MTSRASTMKSSGADPAEVPVNEPPSLETSRLRPSSDGMHKDGSEQALPPGNNEEDDESLLMTNLAPEPSQLVSADSSSARLQDLDSTRTAQSRTSEVRQQLIRAKEMDEEERRAKQARTGNVTIPGAVGNSTMSSDDTTQAAGLSNNSLADTKFGLRTSSGIDNVSAAVPSPPRGNDIENPQHQQTISVEGPPNSTPLLEATLVRDTSAPTLDEMVGGDGFVVTSGTEEPVFKAVEASPLGIGDLSPSLKGLLVGLLVCFCVLVIIVVVVVIVVLLGQSSSEGGSSEVVMSSTPTPVVTATPFETGTGPVSTTSDEYGYEAYGYGTDVPLSATPTTSSTATSPTIMDVPTTQQPTETSSSAPVAPSISQPPQSQSTAVYGQRFWLAEGTTKFSNAADFERLMESYSGAFLPVNVQARIGTSCNIRDQSAVTVENPERQPGTHYVFVDYRMEWFNVLRQADFVDTKEFPVLFLNYINNNLDDLTNDLRALRYNVSISLQVAFRPPEPNSMASTIKPTGAPTPKELSSLLTPITEGQTNPIVTAAPTIAPVSDTPQPSSVLPPTQVPSEWPTATAAPTPMELSSLLSLTTEGQTNPTATVAPTIAPVLDTPQPSSSLPATQVPSELPTAVPTSAPSTQEPSEMPVTPPAFPTGAPTASLYPTSINIKGAKAGYYHIFDYVPTSLAQQEIYHVGAIPERRERFCGTMTNYTAAFAGERDSSVVETVCGELNDGVISKSSLYVVYNIFWESQAVNVSEYPYQYLEFVQNNTVRISADLQAVGLPLVSTGEITFDGDAAGGDISLYECQGTVC